MADSTTTAQSQSSTTLQLSLPPNSITTARTVTNQQLGTLASSLATNSSSLTTALNSITSALNALPAV